MIEISLKIVESLKEISYGKFKNTTFFEKYQGTIKNIHKIAS